MVDPRSSGSAHLGSPRIPKYDKRGLRYTRSAGGGPQVPPDAPVHFVYLAWASVRGRTRHDAENRAFLEAISRSGDPAARVLFVDL